MVITRSTFSYPFRNAAVPLSDYYKHMCWHSASIRQTNLGFVPLEMDMSELCLGILSGIVFHIKEMPRNRLHDNIKRLALLTALKIFLWYIIDMSEVFQAYAVCQTLDRIAQTDSFRRICISQNIGLSRILKTVVMHNRSITLLLRLNEHNGILKAICYGWPLIIITPISPMQYWHAGKKVSEQK